MPRPIHRMPGVMPYRRITAQSSKPLKPRLKRLGIILFIVGIAIAIYWTFFKSSVFAITTVEHNLSDIPVVANRLNQLAGRNIFDIGQLQLEDELQKLYPPLAHITIARGLPHAVRVTGTLRTPALRWKTHDQIVMLDAEGEDYELVDASVHTDLPLVHDSSGVEVAIGQRVVSPAFVTFVRELHTGVPEILGRSYQQLEITETTFHIDAILEGDVRLRVTSQRPIREQLDSAKIILTDHPDAKYIDVRVPRWGYWKP